LVGKLEGRRPLVRRTCRRDDNIRMDVREIASVGVVWMNMAQDKDHRRALVNTVTNTQAP